MERKINCPIPEEDLNIVGNWLVFDIYHERNSFENSFRIYPNYSLKDVILDSDMGVVDVYWDKIRGNYFPNQHNYMLDRSYHYNENDNQTVINYSIACTQIINLDEFNKEQYVDFLWGWTNNKHGLLDIKNKEKELLQNEDD